MRGFNSSFVRTLKGAEEYDRAITGWDDFVRRAAAGKQVLVTDENAPPPPPPASDAVDGIDVMAMLVDATNTVERENAANTKLLQESAIDGAPKAAPTEDTLSLLADIAATSQPLPAG